MSTINQSEKHITTPQGGPIPESKGMFGRISAIVGKVTLGTAMALAQVETSVAHPIPVNTQKMEAQGSNKRGEQLMTGKDPQYTEAIAQFTDAIRLNASWSRPLTNRGSAYVKYAASLIPDAKDDTQKETIVALGKLGVEDLTLVVDTLSEKVKNASMTNEDEDVAAYADALYFLGRAHRLTCKCDENQKAEETWLTLRKFLCDRSMDNTMEYVVTLRSLAEIYPKDNHMHSYYSGLATVRRKELTIPGPTIAEEYLSVAAARNRGRE